VKSECEVVREEMKNEFMLSQELVHFFKLNNNFHLVIYNVNLDECRYAERNFNIAQVCINQSYFFLNAFIGIIFDSNVKAKVIKRIAFLESCTRKNELNASHISN
jgi:hypothetical protein